MKPKRTAHPQTCRGCRHDVLMRLHLSTKAVQNINGFCSNGNKNEWPDGCEHYAETAHKPRRGHDLVKG